VPNCRKIVGLRLKWRANVNKLPLKSGVRGGIAALWFCLFVGTFAASSQTIPLPYVPVTAEYSSSLDRIIFIAANPNQLHIFDPMTNTDTAVNLSKPPLSLSVSLDGQHAAEGHDSLISYVNLAGASVEQTLATTSTVTSLVLGNDYVYILTNNGNSGTGWIQISTSASGSYGYYSGTVARLHPSGTAIYATGSDTSGFEDINVSTGPPTAESNGPYLGTYEYSVCGGVWFSPDGRRVYTGCAEAFQANPQDTNMPSCCSSTTLDTSADGLYWATLAGAPLIRSLTESATLGRVAVIPYSEQ
jgi:chitinase